MSSLAENIWLGNPISNTTSELQDYNNYFVDKNYDAFLIDNALKGNSLMFTMMYIYNRLNWKTTIPQVPDEVFQHLAYKLQSVYRPNYYHNQVHAADVTQMLYNFIYELGLKELTSLSDTDSFFTIISGAAHDMDHPGTNNIFEMKNRSKLALLYNDMGILENHHSASFFFLVDNCSNNCDIF